MKRKALLILIGGRQMPNFLTAQYLKPDLVMPIASKEAMTNKTWERIKSAFEPICVEVCEPKIVNAVDLENIKEKCQEAISENNDFEWVFNVTCATSVMSIGAYEVAKKHNLDCWYLDTNSRQVAVLNGKPPDSDLYNVSIKDYLKIYGRTILRRGSENLSNDSINFIRKLAGDADFANKFQQSYQQSKNTGIRGQKVISNYDQEIMYVWLEAEKLGLVSDITENSNGKLFLNINSQAEATFLNGGWLETYFWMVAKNENCFDDLGYSLVIPAKEGAQYEIDFALTYAGMLLIAECKTGKSAFDGKHLEHLNTVANHLGSNFVGKIFITNQVVNKESYGVNGFFEQAKQNHIMVIHSENLPDLAEILRKESGVEAIKGNNPSFFRG